MKQKVLLLAALLAVACKAERAVPQAAMEKPAATDTAARIDGPPPPIDQRVSAAPPAPPGTQLPNAPALPRMIIRTAEVSLIVGNATSALEQLTALAAANGGYVTDSRVWRDGEVVRATLTLRVPA